MAIRTSYIKCTRADKTSTFEGGINVKGNLTFGDASVDTLTVNGATTFNQDITIAAGKTIVFNSNMTQTTVGAAGSASALPTNPTGYLKIKIGATTYVVPYYASA